jgi:hypothetical protein
VGKNFNFSTSSRPALELTQPPNQRVPGAFSLGVKRLESEADHSPPTSAEVKKVGLYIHSPIRLHGVVLNKLSTWKTLPFIFNCVLIPFCKIVRGFIGASAFTVICSSFTAANSRTGGAPTHPLALPTYH